MISIMSPVPGSEGSSPFSKLSLMSSVTFCACLGGGVSLAITVAIGVGRSGVLLSDLFTGAEVMTSMPTPLESS